MAPPEKSSDPPRREEVQEWIEKSREDLEAARRLIEPTPEPILVPAAFHCQQSAEKALKALLVHEGVTFRKVHDLMYLLDLCQQTQLDEDRLREPLSELAPFAVDERYPTGRTELSTETVDRLLQTATKLLHEVEDKIEG
jgi:HEPN domain-containing protein